MSQAISLFDRVGMDSLRKELRVDPFLLRRWKKRLLKQFVTDAEAARDLPGAERIALHRLQLCERVDSQADGATKLLLRTDRGMLIETVILRIASGRTTVCVSSQIGCAAACAFCATGQMGIARQLAPAEILDQVLIAGQLLTTERRRLRNIVFMGMGEPFHNEANLYEALEDLTSADMFHHSPTRILVSTVGVPDAMLRCVSRFPAVNLALSLHSVRQEVRERLIPLARLCPLPQLRETVLKVNEQTNTRLMIEYLLLAGVNDSVTDAAELAVWLQGLHVHVNLIPYNQVPNALSLTGSDSATREKFASVLKLSGIKTTIRYSLGQDISAACGQLVRTENRRIALQGIH